MENQLNIMTNVIQLFPAKTEETSELKPWEKPAKTREEHIKAYEEQHRYYNPQDCAKLDKAKIKYKPVIEKLLKAHEENTFQLAVIVVKAADDILTTVMALEGIEPRFLAHGMSKKEDVRYGQYRYPSCHMMVMSRKMFQNDYRILTDMANLNKLVVVSDKPVELPKKARYL